MTWQFNPERGDITDPDVPIEDTGFDPRGYAYYGGDLICETVRSTHGPLFVNAPAMLALLKEYVAADPCAAGDPRHAKACALIEAIEPMPETEEQGLDLLHRASVRLAAQFQMTWPRDLAKANLDARAIIFNVSNKTFIERGMGISREEVEGAAILDKIDLDDLPF